MSELDEQEARVRVLLAEVRGATKDLTQVIKAAEDMRRVLIDEEVRPLVGEAIGAHLKLASESLEMMFKDSNRVVKAKMNEILIELEYLRAGAQHLNPVEPTGFFARNTQVRKPR